MGARKTLRGIKYVTLHVTSLGYRILNAGIASLSDNQSIFYSRRGKSSYRS